MKNSFLILMLIAINILVFFLWFSASTETQRVFMQENFAVSWEALAAGRWWVLLTSVFSHQMFFHLIFNMMVLNSFGPVVADAIGTRFFIIFYFIAGVLSSLSHAVVTAFFLHAPNLPAVGASGALAGVLLLFCLMYPREKILLFAILPLPAMWGAVAFVVLDIWGLIAQSQGGGLPIGHGAHLGGAFCGLLGYMLLRRSRATS
ncbi:MAG: rhomboid family intramembrane serine protease [Bdellovibrionaceae bacterium]|nr:rhomboid family intramembrane serine protease [Pseudobdellovibrionaceae bacterium]